MDHVADSLTLSASGIKTWNSCQRKWGWTYIAGLRPESSGGGAALGSDVHRRLESFLKGGPLDAEGVAGKCASALIPTLPLKDFEIEKYFVLRDGDVSFRGFIDVLVQPGEDGIPTIIDHKTCSTFGYILTKETLPGDIAAILYARYAMERWPSAPGANLRWNYVRTRNFPEVRTTSALLGRGYVEEQYENLKLDTNVIRRHLTVLTNPLDLEPNWDHCNDYGGCPFRNQCRGDVFEKMEAQRKNMAIDNDFLSRLMNPAPVPLTVNTTDPVAPKAEDPPQINPPEQHVIVPVAEVVETVPEPVAAEKAKRTRKPKTTAPEPVQAEGYDLFINCAPAESTHTTMADKLIAQANKEICEKAGAEDYRLPPLNYGQGTALLAARVLELTKGVVNLVLNDKTPEGSAVVSVLVANARTVTRGF